MSGERPQLIAVAKQAAKHGETFEARDYHGRDIKVVAEGNIREGEHLYHRGGSLVSGSGGFTR